MYAASTTAPSRLSPAPAPSAASVATNTTTSTIRNGTVIERYCVYVGVGIIPARASVRKIMEESGRRRGAAPHEDHGAQPREKRSAKPGRTAPPPPGGPSARGA